MTKTLIFACAAASLLSAAPLDRHERDFAIGNLNATTKMFLDAVAGLRRSSGTSSRPLAAGR